jgi:peptidoglycan/xylan/chitin deacetylase (PgdA/CDA1 family)
MLVGAVSVLGCSGPDLAVPGGSGGTTSMGTTATGGSPTTNPPSTGGATSTGNSSGGATTPTGGTSTTGGAISVGGSNSTGGVNGKGGTSSSGGSTAIGGTSATGGNKAAGGTSPTGGTSATGGNKAAGGTTPTGGTSATGGSKATGGTSPTGGNAATGGNKAAGGTSTTGGSVASGGSSPAGGSTAVAVKCSNLSASAGATGNAKPSGAVGGLRVLDWAGFTGAVSFTFDDGNSSQISNYSQLNATGAKATFFLVTGWSNASNAIWKTAVSNGHEIGNHTKSHSSTASQSDLQAAEDWIKTNLGVTAYTMAAPNGDASWASVAPALMIANRGVSNGLVGPRDSTNAFSLPAYLPPTGASSSAMDAEVNAAKTGNKWKIFCVHGFTGDSAAYQPVDVTNMTTTMSNAVKNGLWADTMMNVAAYWLGQKAISASATTSTIWTLPANFPPNMCVRVTTTGGTVKQNGAEVPWNDHGYYEISLDAKSVTIQ